MPAELLEDPLSKIIW